MVFARRRFGVRTFVRVPRPLCGLLLDLTAARTPTLLLDFDDCVRGVPTKPLGKGGLGVSRSEVKEEPAKRAGDTNAVEYPVCLFLT